MFRAGIVLSSCLCLLLWSDFVPEGATLLFASAKTHKKATADEPSLPYVSDSPRSPYLCKHIPMPDKSIFTGLDPPSDPLKWVQAIVSPAVFIYIIITP